MTGMTARDRVHFHARECRRLQRDLREIDVAIGLLERIGIGASVRATLTAWRRELLDGIRDHQRSGTAAVKEMRG